MRELRADPALRAIPVILLSARAGEEARIEGLGKGADDYLVKPFSARELLVRVGHCCSPRSAAQAREALREADQPQGRVPRHAGARAAQPARAAAHSLDILKLRRREPHASPARRWRSWSASSTTWCAWSTTCWRCRASRAATSSCARSACELDVALRNALEASEPLIRAGGHRLTRLAAARARCALDGDPVRLGADLRQPAQQRRQVYRDRRRDHDRGAREGGEAVVTISDNGDGIEPEQLPQIFDMFARGNRSASAQPERPRHRPRAGAPPGRDARRARRRARAKGRGKGSRFTVRLPLGTAQPRRRAGARRRARRPLPSMSILVVDDNRDAAESLRMLLRAVGAEVRVAHDGADGARGVRGVPAARGAARHRHARHGRLRGGARLRAAAGRPRAALVALTGWGQDEDRAARARPASTTTWSSRRISTRCTPLIASIQREAH